MPSFFAITISSVKWYNFKTWHYDDNVKLLCFGWMCVENGTEKCATCTFECSKYVLENGKILLRLD